MKTIRLFDLEKEIERVSLVTYDHKVHREFRFEIATSTREAIALVSNAKFHCGAKSTNRLINYISNTVLPTTRKKCKTALFLISDGQNNWGSKPKRKVKELKLSGNFEIYAIAIGESHLGWESLKEVSSGPKYFFAVRDIENIGDIITICLEVPVPMSKVYGQCF